MKYGLLLIISFCITSCGASKHQASDQKAVAYLIVHPSIRILDIDPLGNLYILDANDRLSKYDTAGHLLYHVVNNNLGQVHSLDVGNPFKTMVFYRDQQMILLYDRTLSEIQLFRLSDWDLHDITAACLSSDNAIWLFDGMNKVLLKTNQSGGAIVTSDPFDMIRPASTRPDFIHDMDHLLLLKEINQPVSVFDDFGKYLYSTIPHEAEIFSVMDHILVTGSASSIQLYDLEDRIMLDSIPQGEDMTGKHVYLFAGHLYVYDDRGVYRTYP